jgi:hypothetical protein
MPKREEIERTTERTIIDIERVTTRITVRARNRAEAERILAEYKARRDGGGPR